MSPPRYDIFLTHAAAHGVWTPTHERGLCMPSTFDAYSIINRSMHCMERGSSVVKCRTRNRDLVLARNFCLARMLPGEAELVSE